MKRFALLLSLFLILLPAALWAAMSDSSAQTKASAIWGPKAMIGTMRKVGDTYWTKQVGYSDDAGNFVVIGSGSNTWEAAFATIPVDYTPPVPHQLSAVFRWTDGTTAETAPINVYVCNVPCIVGTIPRLPLLVAPQPPPTPKPKPLPDLRKGAH